MHQAYQWKDIEYPEILYFTELGTKYFKSEQLAEENVSKLMAKKQGKKVGKIIENFIASSLIPILKLFFRTKE